MTKVLARDLYRQLREGLGGEMKAHGYRRLKLGSLGWVKEIAGQNLCIWFQCDRYGWFEDFGSQFTLEFQLERSATPGSWQMDKRARYFELLDSSEQELVRALNNDVVSSLPEPRTEQPVLLLRPDLLEAFLSAYQLQVEPYQSDRDVWLKYFTEHHVRCWAAFFRERLPRLADTFLARLVAA